MPKINLTAIVSDIKGKSNGSVFSRNKGGNYFRNNPKPVQQKSQAWGKQKTRFSSVSTQWKALSEEDREAWTTIAPEYPQVDTWGKTYIPSGYQLYMKLNSQLFSNGFPILQTPLSPTELAISDEIELYYPENFAFTPTAGANLRGIYNRTPYLLGENFINSVWLAQYQALCMRLVPDLKNNYLAAPGSFATIYSLVSDLNLGQFAYLTKDNNSNIILNFVCNYIDEQSDVKSRINKYNITELYNTGAFHLTFYCRIFEDSLSAIVYFNGVVREPFDQINGNSLIDPNSPPQSYNLPPNIEPTPFLNFAQANLRAGDYTTSKSRLFSISDIRKYLGTNPNNLIQCEIDSNCPEGFICEEGQCVLAADRNITYNSIKFELVAKGYVLGDEISITPLNKFTNSQFATSSESGTTPNLRLVTNQSGTNNCVDCVGSDVECQNGVCVYVGDKAQATRNLGVTFTPFVLVIPYNTELPSMYMNVFASKPLGLGKTNNNQAKVSMGNTAINGRAFDISSQISNQFSSMNAETKVVLTFQVIAADTGQATIVKPKPKPLPKKGDTIRFKAGSELSSSVN
jgi:hypothetical protein